MEFILYNKVKVLYHLVVILSVIIISVCPSIFSIERVGEGCCQNGHGQGHQENFWAPGQKETWPPPPNGTHTKSTMVCHK